MLQIVFFRNSFSDFVRSILASFSSRHYPSPRARSPPQVRWFVLRAFMERHAFPRIFYLDSDVLLFANITDLSAMLFRRVPILLSVRWPRYAGQCTQLAHGDRISQ